MAENSQSTERRRGKGRPFQPGQTGNPGGRPKGLAAAVRARFGDDGLKLIDALAVIAVGTAAQCKTLFGVAMKVSVRDRREAIKELLDRGWGKPVQQLEHGGTDGQPIRVLFGGRFRQGADEPR